MYVKRSNFYRIHTRLVGTSSIVPYYDRNILRILLYIRVGNNNASKTDTFVIHVFRKPLRTATL